MGFRRSETEIISALPAELIERYINQLLERHLGAPPGTEETDFPAIDIFETTRSVIIEAELPGIDVATAEVSITASALVIEGVKKEVLEGDRVNFLCMERSFGSFRRVVSLTHPIDPDSVKAVYHMGVLQIKIPKVAEKRGRKVIVPITAK